jgi:hypothetical protein
VRYVEQKNVRTLSLELPDARREIGQELVADLLDESIEAPAIASAPKIAAAIFPAGETGL